MTLRQAPRYGDIVTNEELLAAINRRFDLNDARWEQNERRWDGLSDDDRRRVELVARSVVSDLLHEPTRKLRLAGESGAPSSYAETVRELFGLSA